MILTNTRFFLSNVISSRYDFMVPTPERPLQFT